LGGVADGAAVTPANARPVSVVQPGIVPRIHFVDGQTFDPASGEVCRGDHVCRLEPQPAALLALLAERPGSVVTHPEIARRLWPEGTHVDFQAGIHYAVRHVRTALDARPPAPSVIETLPRRGYRLRRDALTSPATSLTCAPGWPWAGGPWRSWRRPAAWAVAVAVLVGTVAVVERRPNDHHARAVALLSALHDLVY
jgi:DNA-binding winged helix-turn-helix (wHTH) protein